MRSEGDTPDSSWFERIADDSGLIFFIMQIQPTVAFDYLGSALYKRLGVPVTPETVADANAILGRIAPESAERLAAGFAMTPGQELTLDLKWLHVDGHPVYSRAWMRAIGRPDGSVAQEGVVLDITELREVENELRRSEQRSRLLAENAYDVIWTMAMDGSVTYVSPSVERVRGITPEEARNQSIEEINTPESAARVTEYYQRVFAAIAAGTEPPAFHGEMEYYRKDGSIMTGELQVIPLVDSDGQVVELLGVTRDISDRKMLEAQLTRLAATDPVTGVWNRHHGTESLVEATAARHEDEALSVLMIDIDNFKFINDSFGHQAGDEVLIEMSKRLVAAVRGTDVVARWGGEEFLILLRECPIEDAAARAEKIRRQIADTRFPGVGTVTVSIGVAQRTGDGDLAAWLGRADGALYVAKRTGRNTVAIS
ncbi:MAG TPA: diguanylate cyclase [Mycobacterium sp.]|nr:diguanylate cyclase [Mycobacterium sp.]HQC75362.1 diguanylate cyclase [Mycobacterium sp.]